MKKQFLVILDYRFGNISVSDIESFLLGPHHLAVRGKDFEHLGGYGVEVVSVADQKASTEDVVTRLRKLADDNTEFVNKLEAGEVDIGVKTGQLKTEGLIRTYRFWSMCLNTAAWLLENDKAG